MTMLQDFDNEGFFSDVTIQPPAANISMIPPVHESDLDVTVHFEELPDLKKLRQSERSATAHSVLNVNVYQLRPKIVQISHERLDSDDEGDGKTHEMLMREESFKLEKLLCTYIS